MPKNTNDEIQMQIMNGLLRKDKYMCYELRIIINLVLWLKK